MFLPSSPLPANQSGNRQGDETQHPADPPPDLHSPDTPFLSERQILHDKRQAIFQCHSKVWSVFETCASVGAGAWAADKFAVKFAIPSPLIRPTPIEKELFRARTLSEAFGATLCSSLAGFAIDRLVAPQDMKMECTVAADWLVQPAISVLPIPWKQKVCLMLGSHEVARLIDHYRQPKQTF